MISDGASAHRPPQPLRRQAHAAPDGARTLGARALALALALGFLVTGCQVGPDYHPPVPPTVTAFSRASGGLGEPGPVETTWWRRFQDPLLDDLIARVSSHNLDLRLAQARLLEARALWTAARFDLAPTVVNDNSYQNSQTSRATRPNEPRHLRHNEVYRFGFDATWELDFWGRARRGIEAARATVAAVEAERDDVLVAVRAELAANYLELRGLQGQLEVARRNATNQAETLRLAEALRDGGQGTQLDVARARSQLATTRAGIPAVEAATDRALHRIALLCGWPAAEHTPLLERLTSPSPLPEPASGIALGQPEELLRRRPDIRTSERQLAAATASIGLQVADLFPRLTVSGNVALEANRLSGFSGPGLDAWGFGPRLSWAAFDLGRVRQRIRAA
ncbi:MAG: efflux transporter outer membrane subunit, partial [Verrucomicrobiales bacterium]|nr:efflux transporter outer membrane subunit [Verrucomicrobiales bacterium]